MTPSSTELVVALDCMAGVVATGEEARGAAVGEERILDLARNAPNKQPAITITPSHKAMAAFFHSPSS